MKTFTLAIRITTVVALSLLMVQCGNKQAAPNQSVSDDTTISSYGDKLPIVDILVGLFRERGKRYFDIYVENRLVLSSIVSLFR